MINLERVSGRSTEMRCSKCKFLVGEKEELRILGVERHGDEGYINTGDKWMKYPSWYCLKFFDTYDQRIRHDKRYHKKGDFMAGCVPSGFTTIKPTCGND